MSGIRFIHAADLHLDSPFVGLKNVPEAILHKMKEAPFLAFRKLIEEAIARKVDFILLAGDLYDGENRSLRTQVRFRREMERLLEHGIQVYIIHGNHDHLGGKGDGTGFTAELIRQFPATLQKKPMAPVDTVKKAKGVNGFFFHKHLNNIVGADSISARVWQGTDCGRIWNAPLRP